MKLSVSGGLLGVGLLALVAVAAGAAELTVNSILSAHDSGAPADRIARRKAGELVADVAKAIKK
jgi:hypothetical protein